MESILSDLGPAAREWVRGLGEPEFERRQGEGRTPRDAVLGAVYMGTQAATPVSLRNALANAFWAHIQDRLARLAGGKGKREEQRDCLQSTVASILAGQTGLEFRTERQFLSYLARCMDWKFQAQRRLDSRKGPSGGNEPSDPSPGPATSAQRHLDGEAMMSRIDALGSDERYVVLARLKGISIADQAQHLGVSVSTCRRLYLRVAAKLGGEGPPPGRNGKDIEPE